MAAPILIPLLFGTIALIAWLASADKEKTPSVDKKDANDAIKESVNSGDPVKLDAAAVKVETYANKTKDSKEKATYLEAATVLRQRSAIVKNSPFIPGTKVIKGNQAEAMIRVANQSEDPSELAQIALTLEEGGFTKAAEKIRKRIATPLDPESAARAVANYQYAESQNPANATVPPAEIRTRAEARVAVIKAQRDALAADPSKIPTTKAIKKEVSPASPPRQSKVTVTTASPVDLEKQAAKEQLAKEIDALYKSGKASQSADEVEAIAVQLDNRRETAKGKEFHKRAKTLTEDASKKAIATQDEAMFKKAMESDSPKDIAAIATELDKRGNKPLVKKLQEKLKGYAVETRTVPGYSPEQARADESDVAARKIRDAAMKLTDPLAVFEASTELDKKGYPGMAKELDAQARILQKQQDIEGGAKQNAEAQRQYAAALPRLLKSTDLDELRFSIADYDKIGMKAEAAQLRARMAALSPQAAVGEAGVNNSGYAAWNVSSSKSPIVGISDDVWQRFVGTMIEASPHTLSPSFAMGMFQYNLRQLSQLGLASRPHYSNYQGRTVWQADWIPPYSQDGFLSSPDLQDETLRRHMGQLYPDISQRYYHIFGAPSQVDGNPITMSGLLAVCKHANLSGLDSWLNKGRDRENFPNTTNAYLKSNGVF
jgi:hypothetical protein